MEKFNNFDIHKDVDSILLINNLANESEILISFVIPTFNRLDTLKDAVSSVVELEELENISYEILIVDNSSKFGDENESYTYFAKENINQLRYYVNEKNIGMEGNWNRGIQLAKGKYISMLHDDDMLVNTYAINIKRLISFLENKHERIGFILPQIQFFHSTNEIIKSANLQSCG